MSLEQIIQDMNKHNLEILIPNWIHNAAENREIIMKNLKTGKYKSLEKIKALPREPALISGSGPSLDLIPSFDLSRLTIFSSVSHGLNFIFHNIKPQYLCLVDANPILGEKLKDLNKYCPDSTLITNPVVDPSVFKNWKGKVLLVRPSCNSDYIENVLPLQFAERKNNQFFPQIEPKIVNAGCVINFSLQIIARLGFSATFLLGVDFSFPSGQTSCLRYSQDLIPQDRESINISQKSLIHPREQISPGKIQQFHTTIEMLMYKENFLRIWAENATKLYNLSPMGSSFLYEVPHTDPITFNNHLEDLIQKYPYSTRQIIQLLNQKIGGKKDEKMED